MRLMLVEELFVLGIDAVSMELDTAEATRGLQFFRAFLTFLGSAVRLAGKGDFHTR